MPEPKIIAIENIQKAGLERKFDKKSSRRYGGTIVDAAENGLGADRNNQDEGDPRGTKSMVGSSQESGGPKGTGIRRGKSCMRDVEWWRAINYSKRQLYTPIATSSREKIIKYG